jgi:gliding motility-associated-like protein
MRQILSICCFISALCLLHLNATAQTITAGTASGTIYACLGSPSATNTVVATVPIQGLNLDNVIIPPDGSRVYVTDDGTNTVHVINTATNTVVVNVPAGINPLINYNSISKGNGCSGLPKTFTITVNAVVPVIITSGSPAAASTTYGSPSTTSSFVISGKNMGQGITVTPPAGFEISTNGINFTKSLTIGAAGNIGETTIYARLAGATNAGTYSGNFLLTSPGATAIKVPIAESLVSPREIDIFGSADKTYGDMLTDATYYYNTPGFIYPDPGLQNGNTFYSIHFGFTGGYAASAPVGTYGGAVVVSAFDGRNGFLSSNYNIVYKLGDVAIEVAPLTVTAKPVNKPYGMTLNNAVTSTDFTVTGLKNSETIGNVILSYGSGAAATDPANVYIGSVSVSGASGGTFNPNNYDIKYVPADVTVIGAPVAAITIVSMPAPVNTVYGTASESSNFSISGTTLSTGITVTPPAGFEVSTDNVNFNSTVIAGTADLIIYIRLAATTDAGPYEGNIELTSGTIQVAALMPKSIVTPASLTIAGLNEDKTYGTALQNYIGSQKFTVIAGSLKNGNLIKTVSITYGEGAAAGAAVGTYIGSATPNAVTGDNGFKISNYIVMFSKADVAVLPAKLTVTADNQSRQHSANNPVLTFTYSGFVNGDTEAQITTPPTILTTAMATSQPGKYPISISAAVSLNYTFIYIYGTLTIYALPNAILIVPNTFTPNGDGINDTWNLPALIAYPNCTVNIYDRYGQKVFHSIGYAISWDGQYNNKKVPTGVYYYIIDRKNNTEAVSGSLTVLR